VGDDSAGDLQRRELARHGVESHVTVVPGCMSQSSYILVDRKSGERTILFRRDDRLNLRRADLRRDWIESARLVHLDGHNATAGAVAARWARAAGAITIADLDHSYPGIRRLLDNLDYPITSRTFPSRFTGEAGLFRAMQRIRHGRQCRAVCSTLGNDGALLWDGERFWYVPSYRVRAVDTTGAGDIFHAAFAFGLLKGWGWRRLLDFSCAAAALNCEALGARGGIRPLREIERLRTKGRRNSAAFSDRALARAAAAWRRSRDARAHR